MVTTYGKNLFMDHLFKTPRNPSLPESYYLAWSTAEPTVAGDNFSEPDGATGYSRILMTGLVDAVDGLVTNGTLLSFDESVENQGTATYWGIFDAPSAGNLIMYGQLEKSRVVESETTLSMKAGSLNLELVDA